MWDLLIAEELKRQGIFQIVEVEVEVTGLCGCFGSGRVGWRRVAIEHGQYDGAHRRDRDRELCEPLCDDHDQ